MANEFVFDKSIPLGDARLIATVDSVRCTWTGTAWVEAATYADYGTTGLLSPTSTTIDGVNVYTYDMPVEITDPLNIKIEVWQDSETPSPGTFATWQVITWTGTEVFSGDVGSGGGGTTTPVQATVDDNGAPETKYLAIGFDEIHSYKFILLDSNGDPLDEHADTYKLVVYDALGTWLFQVNATVGGDDNNEWTSTIDAEDEELDEEQVLFFALWNKTLSERRVEGTLTVQPVPAPH